MKRISLNCLWLGLSLWATGCCHSYYSRNSSYDTCASNSRSSSMDDEGYCDSSSPRRSSRNRRAKGDRRNRGGRQDCCDVPLNDCGCDPCCSDGGFSGGPISGSMPVEGGSPMMMPSSGCAGGNCASGAMPSGGGCASGNCGSSVPMPMSTSISGPVSGPIVYNGMPMMPGEGWSMQPHMTQTGGHEPFPVPAASSPTPVNPPSGSTSNSSSGWTTPSNGGGSSVPEPVSFNR